MTARVLAAGRDWRLAEYVCCAGPGDRPFEERHDAFTVATVVEGTFKYRSETASALLYPGAVLLGNCGTCFECGHDHETGDRCIALHVSPEAFAEVASSAAGSERFRFPLDMLPASAAITPWLVKFYADRTNVRLARSEPLDADVSVLQFLEEMIGLTADAKLSAVQVSARDEARLSAIIRYIELNSSEKLDLNQMSTIAGVSKYHFLRTFRRTVGLTPHQFVLGIRLRRAAGHLLTTAAPIAAIAFEAGFGDLSTFNARFRKQFGVSPRGYRVGSLRDHIRQAFGDLVLSIVDVFQRVHEEVVERLYVFSKKTHCCTPFAMVVRDHGGLLALFLFSRGRMRSGNACSASARSITMKPASVRSRSVGMLETLVGSAAAIFTTISYVPQVRKTWVTGETGDLSLKMLILLATGLALWMVYGLLKSDWVLVAANGASFGLVATVLSIKLHADARPKT
jgi:AraC-like DNA-binding protein/uncharacterized protein with PQ loop repeat